MKKECVAFKLTSEEKDLIEKHYKKFQVDNDGEYIDFFAKKDDIAITIYVNKKEQYKITFLGINALKEAKKWNKDASISEPKTNKACWINLEDQIGSDEVGTGDFFGPISVTASLVRKEDIPFLKELGVDDSKRLKDDQIIEIARILIKRIPYSQVSLDNEKYNELEKKGININAMKAMMHNQVLSNLVNKYHVNNVFVDQFCEVNKYYEYLDKTQNIVHDINFKTKGETYFPSVAVSSIISRYAFLMKMEKLNKKYDVKIPLGAGKKVDEFAKKFVKTFGKEELNKVVKMNFANYKNLD